MSKNYYAVLGVSRRAELAEIKSAYRTLVKRFHPDTGGRSLEQFVAIQEAYHTLKDPFHRRRYDAKLDAEQTASLHARPWTDPMATGQISIDDMIWPFESVVQTMGNPFSETIGETVGEDSLGIFLEGLATRRFAQKTRNPHQRDLYMELSLTPEEANRGGIIPLQIPLEQVCPECAGSGYLGVFFCSNCKGGMVQCPEIRMVVPPGVSDQEHVTLSLEDVGLPQVKVHVLIHIID